MNNLDGSIYNALVAAKLASASGGGGGNIASNNVTAMTGYEEAETGIVNEPIRKIGDYADTVSGITIPTIAGADSFDVLTTLKPSEVTVNYKGWHPVSSVHERDNGAWT